MLTFPSAPNHVRTRHKAKASKRKSTFFFWRQTDFSPIPPNASRMLPVHGVIHIPKSIFYLGFLFWHLWKTHPPSARAWTPALTLHLNNPCAKRKVLSLTKPKGKIYKTKSLGHYITWCSIHARYSKSSLKHPIRFCGIFFKFKTEFYCISFF